MLKKIINPLKQDEREILLELSSLTAKNKVFSPYERKLIYSLGHYSELFEFLLEKSPGLIFALKDWCKEKKLTKFSKKLEIILKKIEYPEKKIKITEEDINKLSINNLVKKADKLQNIGNDDSDIEAFKYYLKAANKGSGYAQHEVGDYYYCGTCYKWNHKYKKPKPDYFEAVKWFKKSQKNKHPEAFSSLAVCYTNGEGVENNIKKAIILCEKAFDLDVKFILEILVQNLAEVIYTKIINKEDIQIEKTKLQKYIRASKEYFEDLVLHYECVTDESDLLANEYYEIMCLKLSKTYAIGAFMEGDYEQNKKDCENLLIKSKYQGDPNESEFIQSNFELSEAIFSSNISISSESRLSDKKIIPFPNKESIDKHYSLEAYRQQNDEEEKWIEQGEDSHQEFKDRIFFLYDKDDAKNHPKAKYKRQIASASAIEIAKKICGFLNNSSIKDSVIRLGIGDKSEPVGIDKDIEFFKSNDDDEYKTKEKIKRNLLYNLARLLPTYNLIEADYKKFKGITYLNLIIKNKFKNPGTYIALDEKIFGDANSLETKKISNFRNWEYYFFVRMGEDTTKIPPENAKDHIKALELLFEENI